MTPLFADMYYYLALLGPSDKAHQAAVNVSRQRHVRTVTTEFVLLVLADRLAAVAKRLVAARLIHALRRNSNVTIVPACQELLDRELSLYESRRDKEWTLTDCTSFVVMQDSGLAEALTGDRHFVQSGFTALLLQ